VNGSSPSHAGFLSPRSVSSHKRKATSQALREWLALVSG
jgi:hypothetical protein